MSLATAEDRSPARSRMRGRPNASGSVPTWPGCSGSARDHPHWERADLLPRPVILARRAFWAPGRQSRRPPLEAAPVAMTRERPGPTSHGRPRPPRRPRPRRAGEPNYVDRRGRWQGPSLPCRMRRALKARTPRVAPWRLRISDGRRRFNRRDPDPHLGGRRRVHCRIISSAKPRVHTAAPKRVCAPRSTPTPPPRLVTLPRGGAMCDEETLPRVLGHGKHYRTGGRRPRPYWLADDFEDCLGLVEIETNRGGLP